MNWLLWVIAISAAGLVVYLFMVLLFPEERT